MFFTINHVISTIWYYYYINSITFLEKKNIVIFTKAWISRNQVKLHEAMLFLLHARPKARSHSWWVPWWVNVDVESNYDG